ncbi:MAG: type II toxin-antitoxin system RelE/ParE family toxin [Candidatus Omnitrophica bacterium]|nr:type II toxin-antitoxin system RelE/ParE family toxin [Candidatus Omnitrophota bacterium]
MIASIIESVGQLAEHPRIGRAVPEFSDENLRELIHRPYRIVYRVEIEGKNAFEIRPDMACGVQ